MCDRAQAQLPQLGEVSAQYLPGVSVAEPAGAEAQVSTYDAQLNVPIAIGDSSLLIPGLNYHSDTTSFDDVPDDFAQLRAFHALDVPLLFIQLLPHAWSLSARVAPGLAGDLRKLDVGLVRLSAMAMATHVFSPSFTLGFGALASYAFGSFLPLPAAYVDWRPVAHLQVEGFVPAFFQVKLRLGRFELGARAEIAGQSYAVRDRRIAGTWPCSGARDDPATAVNEASAQPEQCFDHLAYSVASVGALVSARLMGGLWLNAYVGRTMYRRFEQLNDDDARVAGGLQRLPDAVLIRVGLSWRLDPTPSD
ncbi:MAG: DUF6268 family outer membrane beta-barrel protein [Polyangiales bacterium]